MSICSSARLFADGHVCRLQVFRQFLAAVTELTREKICARSELSLEVWIDFPHVQV